MSRLENVDALEKQLADLQMSTSRVKKIPPAVPPKKKAQPQVPHSAVVSTLCEPSYSGKITPICNNNASNYKQELSSTRQNQDYANVSPINKSSTSHSYMQNLKLPSKSYDSCYNDLSSYQVNEKELSPPPPPPLPPLSSLHKTTMQTLDTNHNDGYLPPSSPVSSNYSELARATANINYNQDRSTYPPIYRNEYPAYGTSQASSTYESLYEPINPRQHSNITTNNNTSIQNYRSNTSNSSKSPLPKEEEVDTLTNLLVQSITDSQEIDVFGICIKCNGKVAGENSGCSAMGHMYHVKCFRCHKCKKNLQGKPFYAVENEPYCEADYYESLEKCSVCANPILDRILRATGKPYHPKCFTCVECGISLDGIPFTVDAMNMIHCIEDFHKKFAPRCCVCELPIMPEEGEDETVRVVALDRSFHVRCYRCEDCGMILSSEAEGRGCYPLDDHILCKNCNAYRIRHLTNVMTTDL